LFEKSSCINNRLLKKGGGGEMEENPNRRVANALSKYYAYLVVSAPDLLPGPASATKRTYVKSARLVLDEDKETFLGALSDSGSSSETKQI
jgi:hypothetical protein